MKNLNMAAACRLLLAMLSSVCDGVLAVACLSAGKLPTLRRMKMVMPILVVAVAIPLSACGGGGGGSSSGGATVGSTLFNDPAEFQSEAIDGIQAQTQIRGDAVRISTIPNIPRNGISGFEDRANIANAVYLGIWLNDRVNTMAGCDINAEQCGLLTAGRLGAIPNIANLPSGRATYNLVGAGGYLRGPSANPEIILGILTGSLEADFTSNSVSGSLADTLSAGWRLQLDGTITGASISGQANVTPPSQYAGDSVFSGTLPYSGGFAEDGDWIFGESRGTGDKGRRLGFSFVGNRR